MAGVNRYFFNFRKGNEVSHDTFGMYLASLEEARAEACQTCRDLTMLAELSGELASDCEVEVADASGVPLLTLPLPTCH